MRKDLNKQLQDEIRDHNASKEIIKRLNDKIRVLEDKVHSLEEQHKREKRQEEWLKDMLKQMQSQMDALPAKVTEMTTAVICERFQLELKKPLQTQTEPSLEKPCAQLADGRDSSESSSHNPSWATKPITRSRSLLGERDLRISNEPRAFGQRDQPRRKSDTPKLPGIVGQKLNMSKLQKSEDGKGRRSSSNQEK
jgi:hypothetical protein